MKERIFGIETEFGIELLDERGKISFTQEHKLKIKSHILKLVGIKEKSNRWDPQGGNFQVNGSRIYKDIGNHVEYSTPECRSVRDLIIYDKAGEAIVHKIISAGRERKDIKEKLIIYKNNIDSTKTFGKGRSWGCHENYMVPTLYFEESSRKAASRVWRSLHLLVPFLVTRQIYSGAGWFFLNDIDGQNRSISSPLYVLSQRTPFINSPGNIDSNAVLWGGGYRSKQMISVKPAQGSATRFRRLEIRVGESNLAEWSTYLKIGTTAIVLRMIEDEFLSEYLPLERYRLSDPVEAFRSVTKDITCKKPIFLSNQQLNPIEIQKYLYLEPAKAYLARYGASEEERDIVEKWEYVLNVLSLNPLNLSDRLDVWIRLKLFLEYMKKYRISWDHWRIGALNLAYGDIDKKKSVFYRLQDLKKVRRIVTDKEIKFAETNPPTNSRARLRGLILKLANKNKWSYTVDWHCFMRTFKDVNIVFPAEPSKRFVFSWEDPFQNKDEKLDRLVEEYKNTS